VACFWLYIIPVIAICRFQGYPTLYAMFMGAGSYALFTPMGLPFFFVALYAHIGRGIYYGSYIYLGVWYIGVLLLLLVIATAFLGYVLPWGQISFWGATVITNLFSAIPIIGGSLVTWLWGGFSVDNPTLTRFFAFHFLIPFAVSAVSFIHIFFLHQFGSNNPLGVSSSADKVPFH